MELEITNLEELDPSKIYHISAPADATTETIQRLALATKGLGLRAFITRDGVKFQSFVEMFEGLPDESKALLLEALKIQPKFEVD